MKRNIIPTLAWCCFGLYLLIVILPIVLKIKGIMEDVSWFWVLSPLAIPVTVVALAFFFLYIFFILIKNSDSK